MSGMDRQAMLNLYKREKEPKVKERILMVIFHKFDGESANRTGKKLGHSHATVLKWTERFEEEGLEGLKDKPRSGKPPKIPKERMERIRKKVEGKDFWTSKQVMELIYEEEGVLYSLRHVERLLHKWGYSLIKPRKKHVKAASREEVEKFKKRRGGR
jgi:putative transposase